MAAGAVIRGAAKVAEKVAKGAKKHGKDLTTKKKPNQKKTEKATKGQRTYREGQRKAAGAGSVATAAGYETANVDLNKGNGLPVADMSRSVDVRGTGKGIRYFQDGKEVRLPKK
jgi:phage protein D